MEKTNCFDHMCGMYMGKDMLYRYSFPAGAGAVTTGLFRKSYAKKFRIHYLHPKPRDAEAPGNVIHFCCTEQLLTNLPKYKSL